MEIGLGIDRSVLGGKVPDMAERSQNLVAAAEISMDRLGLGGGFDNDYVHVKPQLFVIVVQFRKPGSGSTPTGKWVNAPLLSNGKRGMPDPTGHEFLAAYNVKIKSMRHTTLV
jgi:hypothetical protein